jgi:HEAT repeat protein
VPPPAPDDQIQRLMEAWRTAILAHDADTVLMCDRTFVTEPGPFTPALVKSAQTDGDERVRAFSTRVLGKFADPLLIPVFRKQLDDASPFVRENAAWALGELATPAATAARDLEKAMKHDKADAVRRAAGEALEKVRGGSKSHRRAG